VEALCPAFQVRVLRKPLVLLKNASPEDVPHRAKRIVLAANAEAKRAPVAAVLAHEDCDCLEPEHEVVAERIEIALRKAGCPGIAVGVVPAWETEAWWFLWPDLVGQHRSSWREPDDFDNREVGKVRNAKEELARCVGQGQPRGTSASLSTKSLTRSASRGGSVRPGGPMVRLGPGAPATTASEQISPT
jgi:hypothetical protein